MSTDKQLQTKLQSTSEIARTTEVEFRAGLSCRTIDQAIAAPTLTMAIKSIGYDATFATVCLAVTKGMEYFSEGQRLNPAQATLFAEVVMDQYAHESLGDLSVFMRGAALGRYGEESYNGEVVKRGETYGQLTLTRLGEWWRQYLGEKADVLSKIREKESATHKAALKDAIHPSIAAVIKGHVAKASETRYAEGMASRLARLRDALPGMTDEELRQSWKIYPTADERSLIYAEANARNLAQPKLEQAASDEKAE